MAYSYIEYVGDGSTKTFNIPFAYLNQEDIKVYVNGVLTPFTFSSVGVINLSVAPSSGVNVRISRETDATARLVNFNDGSVLSESDLDLSADQVFFIAQETLDKTISTIYKDNDGAFSAQNRRIKNVADPVGAQDAVTKNWAETGMSSQLSQSITQATAAANSAVSATTSATNAAASASLSASKALEAGNSAAAAASSATTATSKAAEASASATSATSSATSASSSAATATTKATEAAASAAIVAATAAAVIPYKYTSYNLTEGQTVVNTSYSLGYDQVYQNGVMLVRDVDYTATTGTSITLTTAAKDGDVLVVIVNGGVKGEKGDNGAAGVAGAAGASNTLTIGTVTGGTTAAATLTGTSPNQVLNLVLPKGDTGIQGEQGIQGVPGQSNTLSIGSVTGGTTASASLTGTAPNQVLNLVLPKGDTGLAGTNGTAATVSVGTVTTGAPGSSVIVTNSGTSSNAVFNFTIPKGDVGATGSAGATGATGATGTAATVSVGTVTTGAAGSSATVTNSGTSSNAVFNFTIPRGADGSGAVSSVGLSMPSGFSVSGSPITNSGTLAVTTTLSGLLKGNGSGFTTASAGTDYVAPSGGIASIAVVAALPGTPNANTLYIVTG